jgi:hypothetical protein
LALQAHSGERLRLQPRETDRFPALPAVAVFPVIDASQRDFDLLRNFRCLLLPGDGHLLLLYGVDSRYPADRLLVKRHRFGRVGGVFQLCFQFTALVYQQAAQLLDLFLREFWRRHSQDTAESGCGFGSMP